MLSFFTMFLIFVTIICLSIFIFTVKKSQIKSGFFMLITIAVLTVFFSITFVPKDFIRWDLIEHFKLLENMRAYGLDYATQESIYKSLPVYNYFVYLISRLPEVFKNLVTAVPLTIDFLIVGYIYKDAFIKSKKDFDGKACAFAVFMWITTFGLKLAISGIRCSLAVSLIVLAIYLEYVKKEHKIFAIVLYVLAVFIHNFALVVILTRLLISLKKPILLMVLSFSFSILIEPISRFVVANISNEYLVFSFNRILSTIDKMGFSSALENFQASTVIIYLLFISVSVYLLLTSIRARKTLSLTDPSKSEKRIVDWTTTVGSVAVGLSFNYLYLERFMFVVSFALFMIIPIYNRNRLTNRMSNLCLFLCMVFLIFFNDIYIFLVNSLGYYFLTL